MRVVLCGLLLGSLWLVGSASAYREGEAPKEKTNSTEFLDRLTTWKECKGNILATWAAQDPPNVRKRLSLVEDYIVWEAELPQGMEHSEIERLNKLILNEYRKTENATAEILKTKAFDVNESELLALDQKILQECGPAPWVLLEKEPKRAPPTVLNQVMGLVLIGIFVLVFIWPFFVWWKAGHPM
jgi:hypothetical protein